VEAACPDGEDGKIDAREPVAEDAGNGVNAAVSTLENWLEEENRSGDSVFGSSDDGSGVNDNGSDKSSMAESSENEGIAGIGGTTGVDSFPMESPIEYAPAFIPLPVPAPFGI